MASLPQLRSARVPVEHVEQGLPGWSSLRRHQVLGQVSRRPHFEGKKIQSSAIRVGAYEYEFQPGPQIDPDMFGATPRSALNEAGCTFKWCSGRAQETRRGEERVCKRLCAGSWQRDAAAARKAPLQHPCAPRKGGIAGKADQELVPSMVSRPDPFLIGICLDTRPKPA